MESRARFASQIGSRLLVLAVVGHVDPGAAREVANTQIKVDMPADFVDIGAQEALVVDVYFQNRRVGQAQILALPGTLRFLEPAAIVPLLPGVAERQLVADALRESLSITSTPPCAPGATRPGDTCCGTQPVRAVLDRDRFRLDLFVDPALLDVATPSNSGYIARPSRSVSMVSAISGSISGSSQGASILALQNRTILASGSGRVASDVYFDSKRGIQLDQARFQADLSDRRLSAGLMYTIGSDLIARRRLVGISIATQLDTRRDRELLEGTPVVVTLGQRAKIDILQDGRIASSRIYEAGNQWLDTSQLPGGSYDIVLRIAEAGQPVREEHRFFARSQSIAQQGHDLVYATAGLLTPLTGRALSVTRQPYLELGYAHRAGPRIALDGDVSGGRQAVIGQLGSTYLGPLGQLRLAGIASSSGAYGGLFQLSMHNRGPIGLTLDLRRIAARKGVTLEGRPLGEAAISGPVDDQPHAVQTSGGTFTQLSGYVGYTGRNRRLALSGSLRSEPNSAPSYSIGPSLRWDLVQRGSYRLSLDLDSAVTQHGRSGFVGISFARTGLAGTASSGFGVRQTRDEDHRTHARFVSSVSAATAVEDFAGGRADLNAGFERQDGDSTIAGSANFVTSQGLLRADLVQHFGGQSTGQYSVGGSTLLALTKGKLVLKGANQSEAVVAVKIGGARPADRFEVLVDEAVVGVVRGSTSFSVPLAPYREYAIRIRPLASDPLGYDSAVRQVSLYPGSVARLVWNVEPRNAAFGRLVMPDGRPARNAIIRNGPAIAQTDDQGYFQMEIAQQARLDVILSDSRRCEAEVVAPAGAGEFAALETVICRPLLGEPTTVAALARPSREK